MDEKDGNYQNMWPTHCISCMDEKDDNYQVCGLHTVSGAWGRQAMIIKCRDETDYDYPVYCRHTVSSVGTRQTMIIKCTGNARACIQHKKRDKQTSDGRLE